MGESKKEEWHREECSVYMVKQEKLTMSRFKEKIDEIRKELARKL